MKLRHTLLRSVCFFSSALIVHCPRELSLGAEPRTANLEKVYHSALVRGNCRIREPKEPPDSFVADLCQIHQPGADLLDDPKHASWQSQCDKGNEVSATDMT